LKNATTVEAYIKLFTPNVQQLLLQMRSTITKAAPKAVESISYGMPAYKYLGMPLVYFGGYEHHIGFYATPTGNIAFKKVLEKYKQGKGSIQFNINAKLPLALVEEIVKFRVKENEVKAQTKKVAQKK
jgi:uncharacterized protein YdhG (YjbR/CyaY superfamily)